MNARKLFAVLLLLTLVLVSFQSPVRAAAGAGYTEDVTVFVAGHTAYWTMSFGGINVSNSLVSGMEGISGITSYNLTALKTTSWSPDFQLLGPSGYNVLPIPFVPQQGLFLQVGSGSYSDAQKASQQIAPLLAATFASTSNASGVYTFFSPLSFSAMAPTLLHFMPANVSGFESQIDTTRFLSFASPIVTLSGVRGSSGFSHTLSLGSISASALDQSNRVGLLSFWGSAKPLVASNDSVSSKVVIHSLSGLVVSSDPGAVVNNNRSAFTGSYTLQVPHGRSISQLNATLVEDPPRLLATRVIDNGVLKTGANVSVTVTLANLSNSTTLENLAINDNWWSGYGFKLVSGSSNIREASLAPAQSVSPTYVLQYTGSGSQLLSIPPAAVQYSFKAGGSNFTTSSQANGFTVSLGVDDPAVFAYLSPVGGFGTAVGNAQKMNVIVKNVGTRAASSVSVNGQQMGGLPADGGSVTVPVQYAAPNILSRNVSGSAQVRYMNPEGQSLTAQTNTVPVVFSYTGMSLALVSLNGTSSVTSPTTTGSVNVTLSFLLRNSGGSNATSVVATGALPSGLTCAGSVAKNATCSGNSVSIDFPVLKGSSTKSATLSFVTTNPRNYLLSALTLVYTSDGFNLTRASNGVPVPAGVSLTKSFTPSPLFGGMKATVKVTAHNGGPFDIYNVTISSTADPFDSVPVVGQPTSLSNRSIPSGEGTAFSFGVTLGASHGSLTPAPVDASFLFGGQHFTVSTAQQKVSVYQPVSASITSNPATPEENKDFSVSVSICNPAAVNLTGVALTLPIPRGVSLLQVSNGVFSNGKLKVAVGDLAAGAKYNATFTAVASSGISIPFDSASLNFTYAGQTISGSLPSQGIVISENVTYRYVVPIGIALMALLATVVLVRKIVGSTSPVSQN